VDKSEIGVRVVAARCAADSWTMTRADAVWVYEQALVRTEPAHQLSGILANEVSARCGYFVSHRESRALVDAARSDAAQQADGA
jgi:hypothetical protein